MIFQAYQAQRGSVMESAAEIMRLGARVQHTQRQNNDWRIVHGLEAGQVISRVESLPQHLQALCRVCWGPFTRDELAEDREWLHRALVAVMQRRRLPGQGNRERPSAEAVRTMQALCWAAIYHHGEVTWPYSRDGLAGPRAIQRWLLEERGEEVDVQRWTRNGRFSWSDIWREQLDILDHWEQVALSVVAKLVRKVA
ncbi:hypothetical protein [Bisbaumannia pacifica]|nr:hypothetical protein [Halomonas pacifica]